MGGGLRPLPDVRETGLNRAARQGTPQTRDAVAGHRGSPKMYFLQRCNTVQMHESSISDRRVIQIQILQTGELAEEFEPGVTD